MEFLIDSGSSVNIINRDTFEKLESLMSLTLERSCVKVYPYGCKTPLPILGKCVVDICSNCTDKRTFATFHVIDAATSCILGKSTSELLCVLTVLSQRGLNEFLHWLIQTLNIGSTVFYVSIKIFLKAQVL